jgi:hypothetical protein
MRFFGDSTDKKPMKKIISPLLAALALAGCASGPTHVQVVDPHYKPLTLASISTNTVQDGSAIDTAILPSGVYQPDFQAQEGVFYRAPARILLIVPERSTPHQTSVGLMSRAIVTGGLVVPISGPRTAPTAIWYESRGVGQKPCICPLKDAVPVQAQ